MQANMSSNDSLSNGAIPTQHVKNIRSNDKSKKGIFK